MENRHYRALEFDKVLDMLAKFTTCDEAKEKALQLEPACDLRDARILMGQTADAHTLIARFGAPSFGGLKNINNSIVRAAAGGSLNTRELLDVAENLRVIRGLNEWRSRQSAAETRIDFLFNSLMPDRFLEEAIQNAILSEDEISDNASQELRDIRRAIKQKSSSIREKLDKIIRSEYYKKILQDAIITQRNGRFVVPVKAEHRGELQGLVHDTSSSGATVFIEPMAVVEANNEIKVLQSREREEIQRILDALSADVGTDANLLKNGYECAVEINLIFAKAKLAFDMKATIPELNNEGITVLKSARHPLLNKDKVVPTSISLGVDFDTLVITGPNTGGKTVSIKTLGLLTLMAMSGLMIPTMEGSRVAVYENVFADIGDEQSIEQSLSTFSSHIVNIGDILKKSNDNSLVLIDELGAGTDPIEGAALAMAILEQLHIQGARIAATTHYAELKAYALDTPGVENGCCEFDVVTLRPTYKLLIGVPGRSNAFAISERLGMESELIERAKALVDNKNIRFEDVVDTLEKKRHEMESAKELAESERAAAERDREAARQAKESIDAKVKAELDKARAEAAKIVENTRRQSNMLLDEIAALRKEAQKSPNTIELAKRAKSQMKAGMLSLSEASDPVEKPVFDEDYVLPRPLKKGDIVYLVTLGVEATVLEETDKKGNVYITYGTIKSRVKENLLRLTEKKQKADTKVNMKISRSFEESSKSVNGECDLRGMNSDEAIMKLDQFLDTVRRSSLKDVRIIHGKGTGILRAAVQSYLKTNSAVKSYRLGEYGEGGDGVTIATLKK